MENRARFKVVAVLPAIVWASVQPGDVSEKVSPSFANAEFSESESVRTECNLASENVQTIRLAEPATKWTKQMAKRFDELSIMEAFGKISPEQMIELEDLAQDRRNLKYPRSAEEVLWEYRQRRITSNLVKAVQEYARFYNFSDPTRG